MLALRSKFFGGHIKPQQWNLHPYKKPNNKMLCINTLSNHPPHTIKHLPTLINERFSQNSLNEEIFNRSKVNYEKALKDSGFQSTKL